MRWIVIGTSVWLKAGAPALAQDSAQLSASLKDIRETASDICDKVSQEGQRSDNTIQ